MRHRIIITFGCILCLCLGILCFHTTTFEQPLPWSWQPTGPFPGTYQYPLSVWPPSIFYPSAGPFLSSGWPAYLPPSGYTPAPRGTPTANGQCPVGLLTGMTLDEEFGPGTSQVTRCIIMNYGIKVVMQINNFESRPGRAYGLGNIANMIDDYKITHGTNDYKIVAINHDGGIQQLLNAHAANPHPLASANVYQPLVEDLIAKGVKFYG